MYFEPVAFVYQINKIFKLESIHKMLNLPAVDNLEKPP